MAGEHKSAERRKEMRYPVEARVIVRKKSGEAIAADAVDISSSGMRLRPCQSCPLDLGDEVMVDIELPQSPDQPFSSWGLGKIAYKNARGIGIQLFGGCFDPLSSGGLGE